MRRKLFTRALLPVVCAALSVAACTEPVLLETSYDSTDLPTNESTLIPYQGGLYTIHFKNSAVTKADTSYIDCQYRVNYGEETGEPVQVSHEVLTAEVLIAANYSEKNRLVTVETAPAGEDPEWTEVIKAWQDAALMEAGGLYWAKANVDVQDDRFVIASSAEEPGLFFIGSGKYGVPAEASYAGTAYDPAPVKMTLAQIAADKDEVDVCTQISPNLRTPSYAELVQLYNLEDISRAESRQIAGMGYEQTSLILPFYGSINIESGAWEGKDQYFGFRGLGANLAGDGIIYTANPQYSLIDYNLSAQNMTALRCVKNTKLPVYVSHQLPEQVTCGEVPVKVVTDPAAFKAYDVLWEATDGTVAEALATQENPETAFTLPANEDTENDREWHLFVNRIPAGVSFVQPRLTDYLRFISCTPAEAGYEAFQISVKCETDKASFTVKAEAADGCKVEAEGSKDHPEVILNIPANEVDQERVFAISINGTDTGKTVRQAAAPKKVEGFSVIWSSGFLTIRNGEYTFAGASEKGMHFKWQSVYGIDYAGGKAYPGKAYGPAEETIDFTAIPNQKADPCGMVAPAGTWRMPDVAEVEELIAAPDPVLAVGKSWTLTDGDQTICLTGGGSSMKGNLIGDTNVMMWTAAPISGGKGKYLMWFTKEGKNPKIASTAPTTAMMVRCVKDR